MVQVNSLSRGVNWIERVEKDNENQVMLKKKQLEIRVIEKGQLLIKRVEKEIIEKIQKLETKDNKVIKTVEEIKKARVKVLRNNKQQIENKLVLKKKKVYILKNKSLRLKIIQLHHNIPITRYKRQ